MIPFRICWVFILCTAGLVPGTFHRHLQGQEFSIYTQVFREGDEKNDRQLACRSHTLLHANRGYDYIAELGQVTITDFGSKKITVLHGSRKIATTFSFDELQRQIDHANDQAELFLEKPVRQVGYNTELATEFIRFQLHPEFEETFDPAKKRLTLKSDVMTYEAICAPPPGVNALETYLKFTDWTAKVNYVLVPLSMLPEPRMKLNEALRSHEVLPIQVLLTMHIGRGVKLKAEHQYQWELEKVERQMIHDWDARLENPATKQVTLKEFREILVEDVQAAAKPANVK